MASKISASGYIQGPFSKLFYEREGNTEGQNVLFIHGLGGTTNAFQPLVPELQDLNLVRFDWSGHGRSSVPTKTSVESYVKDCEAIIKELELQKLVIVGHSLGGLIALHLAAKRPELTKAVVLFGPVRPPPEAGQKALAGRAATVRKDGMVAVADTVVSNAFAAISYTNRRAEISLAREMLTRQDPEGYALAVDALAASTLPAWEKINARVFVVSGEEDKVSTVAAGELTVKDLGNAEQSKLKDVGHWHMLENPAESVKVIQLAASS